MNRALVATVPAVDVVEVLRGTAAGPLTQAGSLVAAVAAAVTVAATAVVLVACADARARRATSALALAASLIELTLVLADGAALTDRRPAAIAARLLLLATLAQGAARVPRWAIWGLATGTLLTVPAASPSAGEPVAFGIAAGATGVATVAVGLLLRLLRTRGSRALAIGIAGSVAALAIGAALVTVPDRLPPYHLERVVVDGVAFDLTVAPATVGRNEVHLYAWDADGAPLPLSETTVEVRAAPGSHHALFPVNSNHHLSYVLELPARNAPDGWELELTATTADGRQLTVPLRLEAP